MTVSHVEVLVEEPSMEAALREILPKILQKPHISIYPHQCKDELIQRLPYRLRGYANWLKSDWRILIIVDRDNDDCRRLKAILENIAADAQLITRSKAKGGFYQVVNRLVIEELESWYFGDWEAVQSAYPRVSKSTPERAKYRDPDAITGGTWEAFERILQNAGYFKGGLRKIEAARTIAPYMNPERNRSRSFQVFCQTLAEMERRAEENGETA